LTPSESIRSGDRFAREHFVRASTSISERNALNREFETWLDAAIRPAIARAAQRVVAELAERGIRFELVDATGGGFSFAGDGDDWLTATWVTTVRFGPFNDPPQPNIP
jgi:hypothetical protein